ncbi:MAG: hypothetical protein N7Q72_04005, partial [Spiroplasma sp. Tabriz.8]|nr:hypothetical protein [Spiroplasma sp. Tabriz.8]
CHNRKFLLYINIQVEHVWYLYSNLRKRVGIYIYVKKNSLLLLLLLLLFCIYYLSLIMNHMHI